ncbi:YgiW/YdeI family stress tolerance OB fold protein [Mannheimia bovis]|uniref:NirD/YgiW/YdeI family stress tolerance protein n=1 Tax=Mannheimia bovis TaxID=2770636 RepID=A0A7H1C4U2_9PAST|nr:NirD/YgiW/YdeI family stress tolerance protein [Mannheimia bovis]QNS15997.1 NirD/YgiW/YdeI family stress tolerance protein [Mannheimia bovis]
MKKLTFTAILASAFLAACSSNTASVSTPAAQEQVFGQKSQATLNIAQVKQQRDDALVTFTGKIVRQVESDEYIVADSTGEIEVEIDGHLWNGLKVTAADTIRISGEVDKEIRRVKVDARSVEKLN